MFLWSDISDDSKRALVAWEYICLPKTVGGWNGIGLKCLNQVAFSKQF